MSDSLREFLVVTDSPQSAQTLAQLRRIVQITQLLEPRLALVVDRPGARESVARMAGVLYVGDGDPGDLPADLTASERLFVAGWVARTRPKARRGENLPWDAPGFQPPDHPPKN